MVHSYLMELKKSYSLLLVLLVTVTMVIQNHLPLLLQQIHTQNFSQNMFPIMPRDLNSKIFFTKIKFISLSLDLAIKPVTESNMLVVIAISKVEHHSLQITIRAKSHHTLVNPISRLFLVHALLIHQNYQHELIQKQRKWKLKHKNSKRKKKQKPKSKLH